MKRVPAPLLVHRRLLKAYGPQGWWPVTSARGGGPCCRPGVFGRLTEEQRLEVCIGAILAQNTAWSNVEKALACLREARIRRLEDLRRVPLQRLAGIIRSSGCFRQKARKLSEFARQLARQGGRVREWLSGDLPSRRAELLNIFGVGPETADTILLYAAGRPAFVVDAYTLRIGRRLGWYRASDYAKAQDFILRSLPKNAKLYNETHALLVLHAKRYCRKAPLCAGCPLREVCLYGRPD